MNERFLKELITHVSIADSGYFAGAHLIACWLPKRLHESLEQLVDDGPVWDGDVISKQYRDDLLDLNLAVRVCVKGEQGFTGGTYLAYVVLQKIKGIREGRVCA